MRIICSPRGLGDKMLKWTTGDPVVMGMIASMPDAVLRVLICQDGLENPVSLSPQRCVPAEAARMLNTCLRSFGKTATLSAFSFLNPPEHCRRQLASAHIFWVTGSGTGTGI